MVLASIIEIRDFFNMETKEFAKQWKELSESDKEYFKQAIGEILGK